MNKPTIEFVKCWKYDECYNYNKLKGIAFCDVIKDSDEPICYRTKEEGVEWMLKEELHLVPMYNVADTENKS